MELTTDLAQLKEGLRRTWMAGDFGQIARYSVREAEGFINRLAVGPGTRVLDVACGTGNTAIPMARKGAQVTGVDIAPNLLEQARARASAEGLSASFDEGDAESLPFPDASYDLVVSMFGAMFAPRPDKVAAELARVCRPGGHIAMANWTPGGFAGQMFKLSAQYLPPPEGVPPPVLWGDERIVRQRFGDMVRHIDMSPQLIVMDFPFPPRQVVQLFRDYFGPVQVAFSRLDPPRQQAYAAALENLWAQQNQAQDGHTKIENEYLQVIATRA
jgi:ubiquinone/menaquinone biosynthesis C-methylase UbiE